MEKSKLHGGILMLPMVVILAMAITGCAPSIHRGDYTEIKTKESPICEVNILKPNDYKNMAGSRIGEIKIEDSGFSINCGENEVFDILKKEACSQAANYVYITSEKEPSVWGSSCYQVSAELYRNNGNTINAVKDENAKTDNDSNKANEDGSPVLTVLGFVGGFAVGYILVTLLLN